QYFTKPSMLIIIGFILGVSMIKEMRKKILTGSLIFIGYVFYLNENNYDLKYLLKEFLGIELKSESKNEKESEKFNQWKTTDKKSHEQKNREFDFHKDKKHKNDGLEEQRGDCNFHNCNCMDECFGENLSGIESISDSNEEENDFYSEENSDMDRNGQNSGDYDENDFTKTEIEYFQKFIPEVLEIHEDSNFSLFSDKLGVNSDPESNKFYSLQEVKDKPNSINTQYEEILINEENEKVVNELIGKDASEKYKNWVFKKINSKNFSPYKKDDNTFFLSKIYKYENNMIINNEYNLNSLGMPVHIPKFINKNNSANSNFDFNTCKSTKIDFDYSPVHIFHKIENEYLSKLKDRICLENRDEMFQYYLSKHIKPFYKFCVFIDDWYMISDDEIIKISDSIILKKIELKSGFLNMVYLYEKKNADIINNAFFKEFIRGEGHLIYLKYVNEYNSEDVKYCNKSDFFASAYALNLQMIKNKTFIATNIFDGTFEIIRLNIKILIVVYKANNLSKK
ncbi:hypothetical protein DMUE_4796, partial [Dictyocoela muelleri]